MTDSSDDTEKKGGSDLKARLGLNKKLKDIEAARQPELKAASFDPKDIAQPPRRTFRSEDAPATGEIVNVDVGSVTKKSPVAIVLISVLASIIVLLAGYTIGKAFQMRMIANTRIINANDTHRVFFEQDHATAGKNTMELFLGYVEEVKKFRSDLDKKLQDPEKQDDILGDMRAFIAKVRDFRALSIDFNGRQVVNKSYYLVETLPSILTLQQQSARINALSDSIIEDAAVLDFIDRYQKDRVEKPEKYLRYFWFKQAPSDKPEDYASAALVLKMAQKEMRKEGRKQWMEQAIIPETTENKEEGIMVPVGSIAPIKMGSAMKAYEDQVVRRMLKSLRVRLDALAETSRGVSVDSLQKKLKAMGGKESYFVL